MKYHYLTALLLLALTSAGAASQSGISLPGREEIARITIEHAPLHLYTTDYLSEALPCFTPAEGGRAETPELADQGRIELKNGDVINWAAANNRSLLIRTRAGSQLFELSGECAYRHAGPAMKLYRYLFLKSDFPEPMPKRVERGMVERFLREILSWRDAERTPARELKELALFYDAQGIVPDLLGRLDGREATGVELQQSIIFTEVVGFLGDEAQREAGRRYYRRLLTLPYKNGQPPEEFRLRALTNCLAAYTPEESTEGLLRRIDQALGRLRPLATNDWAAGREMREVEDMRGVVLLRVGGAGAMKREIMQRADPAKRLDALVDIYLNVDMRYYEFVSDWALHEVVRAGRSGDAREVIAAFRRAIPRLPRESREARRARALHAVEYFGGELTPAERNQRRPFESRYDPLSLEEF
ncbi:MAG TPA: hypothetical protein VJ715_02865 [Pyrinomonadaceae bacterium]|nr:hypothetical protein [Pyrinomonadaceae bacterium]